jgi:putative FmdB family regulatory protein
MPIYEYICKDCKTPFEKLVIRAKEQINCPSCGSKKAQMQLSVFSARGGSESSESSSRSGSSGGCGCTPSGCGCR